MALSTKWNMTDNIYFQSRQVSVIETHDLETGYNPFDYPVASFKHEELGDEYEDLSVLEAIEKKMKESV